jgi:hypothetical protein
MPLLPDDLRRPRRQSRAEVLGLTEYPRMALRHRLFEPDEKIRRIVHR